MKTGENYHPDCVRCCWPWPCCAPSGSRRLRLQAGLCPGPRWTTMQ